MLRVTAEWMLDAERAYPGIQKTIEFYEGRKLPACPACGSSDSAVVSTGIVGRSITVSAATTKMRLIPNGHPGDFCCNACEHLFDASDVDLRR